MAHPKFVTIDRGFGVTVPGYIGDDAACERPLPLELFDPQQWPQKPQYVFTDIKLQKVNDMGADVWLFSTPCNPELDVKDLALTGNLDHVLEVMRAFDMDHLAEVLESGIRV
ncbi:hypothetical protein BOTBODRAFT_168626 [Botryobasidium botryosum FD-172 SS1]|uniref:Uncharacterized protein n=1 Tax=Botryobasidium botryosum (strain FD-172 SS1) TaxID=930990 RepID=A0A067N051_BOTB1|nr:hypothetical protein BOTBODRAFT_168626 [Botryobasidium botryosum FD-172 SS1]